MTTCNRLDLETLGFWPINAQKPRRTLREGVFGATYPLGFEAVRALELGDGEQDEGEREEGEEGDQCDVCSQRPDPHHECDERPSEEEDPERRPQVLGVQSVSVLDAEPRDEDCGVREPEGAIRAEGGGCERVPEPELPHAREHLRDAAVEERHADDGVGGRRRLDAPDAGVVARQHERRRAEGEEPQRDRAGGLRDCNRFVHPGFAESVVRAHVCHGWRICDNKLRLRIDRRFQVNYGHFGGSRFVHHDNIVLNGIGQKS